MFRFVKQIYCLTKILIIMKKLELNQMENLDGGSFWGELTLTGVCGVVGAIAGTATMGAGFIVGFACSAGVLALQHYNH